MIKMISLHVYLSPLPEKFSDLKGTVSETWLPAMTKQPGFIKAYLLQPFDDTELKKIDANIPDHVLEVVSFWTSEQERLDWVERPIHDEVFNQVLSLTEKISYTLKTVENNW